MEKVGQPLMGDRRAVAPYHGPEHVPYVLREPLNFKEHIWPYQDSPRLVTFAVKVPLACVIEGTEAIAAYIEKTYLPPGVWLDQYKLRAIGATFDGFDELVDGAVHLQYYGLLNGPKQPA